VFFYGQCSEICGINHGFMPVVVEGVNSDSTFRDWITQFYYKNIESNFKN